MPENTTRRTSSDSSPYSVDKRLPAFPLAGTDLTKELEEDAPHGAGLLERVPFIGTLVEKQSSEKLDK